jgi:hypothetical protein
MQTQREPMAGMLKRVALTALLSLPAGATAQSTPSVPKNFIFFDRDRQRITEASFLENRNIVGAQLKYTWRELEPERDRYDLKPILDDLAFLEKHGKKLFVQLQDASFSEAILVPAYLLSDTSFHGGVAREYEEERFAGYAPRRWDPAVRARFRKLLEVLGKELDGRIEGINLPETAVGFSETGKYRPAGFSNTAYLEGVKEIMSALRKSFPRSAVIQYANFMPGEWLPVEDHGYLRAVYAHAASIGMGVGGPDLLPHRKGQQNHSLPLIAGRSPALLAGVAVQDGNLEEKNPATGQPVTVAELYDFATTKLRVDYVFWGTQEPFYTTNVHPFLVGLPRRP